MTTVPASANLGAHSKEVDPPAENKATWGCMETAVSNPTTSYELVPQTTFLPIDLSEATGISSVKGKFLSYRTLSITSPTIPVAPTTAIFIVNFFLAKLSFMVWRTTSMGFFSKSQQTV